MINFRNEGAIDIRALTTFGLSSKDGTDSIGRFGTGLKYATAVIARNGGKMRIASGGEVREIGATEDTFRGKEVTQLTCNGEPLPYTTDLGRDWEPWMAFRELYANALDEGGGVFRSEGREKPCGDETIISVDLDKFEAIYFSMEEHFITEADSAIWKSDGDIEVYQGRSLFIFYRGIAIMKLKEPAAFRYNILGEVDLSEDRNAKYSWQIEGRLESALPTTDCEEVARGVADQRNAFEATLDFSRASASDPFVGACVALGSNCNPTAMALVRAQIPASAGDVTIVTKAEPGGAALMVALERLRVCGADLSKTTFVLASGVPFHGDYQVRQKKVFLNERIFSDEKRMTLACLNGHADVKGGHWLAKRLLAVCLAEEKEKAP